MKIFYYCNFLFSIVIFNIYLFIILFYFFLYFKFWGTRADLAGLLHRYTHAMVVCCLHPPITYYQAFLLMLSLPNLPTPCCSSPVPHPPSDPSVWHSPPCAHVFSLFNTCLWVRTCGVSFSVLVSVYWEWWLPYSSMSLQRTWTHPFVWPCSIPWCVFVTFSLSSLSFMGIWVGFRSLLLYSVAINIRVHVSL